MRQQQYSLGSRSCSTKSKQRQRKHKARSSMPGLIASWIPLRSSSEAPLERSGIHGDLTLVNEYHRRPNHTSTSVPNRRMVMPVRQISLSCDEILLNRRPTRFRRSRISCTTPTRSSSSSSMSLANFVSTSSNEYACPLGLSIVRV